MSDTESCGYCTSSKDYPDMKKCGCKECTSFIHRDAELAGTAKNLCRECMEDIRNRRYELLLACGEKKTQ